MGIMSEKSVGRAYAFLSVLVFCMIIAVAKRVLSLLIFQSSHSGPQLALIRGLTSVTMGGIDSYFTGNPLYVREGSVMEDVIVRGFLSCMV